MKLEHWIVIILVTFLGILSLFLINIPSSDVLENPMQLNIERKVIGWIPYWDQENAFQSFKSNSEKIDIISVFWYRLDENGQLSTYESTIEDQQIIDFAKTNNVEIHAIVANLPDYTEDMDWDYKRVDKVISSQNVRRNHINDLVNLVVKKDFDGLDIDYEALKRSQRDNFSIFIEELSDELHNRGKKLGVAIHPKTAEFKPEEDNGSHAQDLKKLNESADYLYFMTYLENGTFSGPGPLGSPAWMENVMNYALNEVGILKEKTFLGIGLMGVEWRKQEDGSFTGHRDDVKFEEIVNIVNNNGLDVKWDRSSHTPYIEYQNFDGQSQNDNVIWFENAPSVRERIELVERLGVGGIAFWRLGGEDTKIWESIK